MSKSENDYEVQVLKTRAAQSLLTAIRNKRLLQVQYSRYCDRLCTLLAEEGVAHFSNTMTVDTPCGTFTGLHPFTNMKSAKEAQTEDFLCAVSILRSGDILLEAVKKICPGIKVGKILIQRDETDPLKRPKLFYSKLPQNLDAATCKGVLLCDPMLATGGSAIAATKVLVEAGLDLAKTKLVFLNCVSCPEGVEAYCTAFPQAKVITTSIDSHLNEDKYIVPGLGDFGDRYYGT